MGDIAVDPHRPSFLVMTVGSFGKFSAWGPGRRFVSAWWHSSRERLLLSNIEAAEDC